MAAARCVEPPRYLHLHQLGRRPLGNCATWRSFSVRPHQPALAGSRPSRPPLAAGSAVPAAGGRPAPKFASFAAASARWLSSRRRRWGFRLVSASAASRGATARTASRGTGTPARSHASARCRPASSTDRRRWRPALGSRDRAMKHRRRRPVDNRPAELVLYGMAECMAGEVNGEVKLYLWNAAVPVLSVIARDERANSTDAGLLPGNDPLRCCAAQPWRRAPTRSPRPPSHPALVEAASARPSTSSRALGVQGAERPDPPP